MKIFKAKIDENYEITLEVGLTLLQQALAVNFSGQPVWVDKEALTTGDRVVYEGEPERRNGSLFFAASNGTTEDQAVVALQGDLVGLNVSGGHTLAQFPRASTALITLKPGEKIKIQAGVHPSLPATRCIHIFWDGNDLYAGENIDAILNSAGLYMDSATLARLVAGDSAESRQAAFKVLTELSGQIGERLGNRYVFIERALELGKRFQAENQRSEASTSWKMALKALYSVPGDVSEQSTKLREEVMALLRANT